jgi:hypothetical protein
MNIILNLWSDLEAEPAQPSRAAGNVMSPLLSVIHEKNHGFQTQGLLVWIGPMTGIHQRTERTGAV